MRDVIGPGRGVDEEGGGAGEGEGGGKSGEELVAARDDDPDGEHGGKGKEEMRLEGAEPERRTGVEGVAAMEAQKKDQSQEREERGLAHGEADDGGGEGEAEPVDAIRRGAVELVDDADGDEQAGEEKQGPEDGGKAQAKKTERVGEGQRPGRVAHDEDGAGVKAGGVLEGRDGVAVVGVAVVDELAAGGPVGDEVARGGQFAGNGDGEDVEDGDGKRQAGDSGNRNFSEVAALLCWRTIQLADHGGYSTAAAAVKVMGS